MEQIRSRKNQYILHLRALAKSADARREAGEYVCDGEKLLREALQFGAEVTSVLWREPIYPTIPHIVGSPYSSIKIRLILILCRHPANTYRMPK